MQALSSTSSRPLPELLIQRSEDYGYLAELSGCKVAELSRPELRFYEVLCENKRCGAFMVISAMRSAPDLHVELTIKGKLALAAVRAVCERIYVDYGVDELRAFIPLADAKTRHMAVAAGFQRIGVNDVFKVAHYVRRLR